MSIERLVAGIHRFRENVFCAKPDFFSQLAQGQSPDVLFITCSDSRIDANLITQAPPGDLFVIRNAGNLVPAYDGSGSGEAASIEFAVKGLGVGHVVICGHTHCGAIHGLLNPSYIEGFPQMTAWLRHAADTRNVIDTKYAKWEPAAKLTAAVEENVLVQLEHLQTHPSIIEALAAGKIELHGCVYELETGLVYRYVPADQQFVPILPSDDEIAVRRLIRSVKDGDAKLFA